MKKLAISIVLGSSIIACSWLTPRNTVPTQATSTAPVSTADVQTTQASTTPTLDYSNLPTDDLVDELASQDPGDKFPELHVIPLSCPAGYPPLWAVFSVGMRSYDTDTVPSHFLIIETYSSEEGWQELARHMLDESADGGGPDYINAAGIRQVLIEPAHVWIEVQGGVGAHGGVYQLFMFDGQNLTEQVSNMNSSPDAGELKDLNVDGYMDVVLDQSDQYIFAYAVGVRKPGYRVLYWDPSSQSLQEAVLQPLPDDTPEEIREPINLAVQYTQAGLWKDAESTLNDVRFSAAQIPDTPFYTWDAILIDLYANSLNEAISTSVYPQIIEFFYGDYAAAVDRLRVYPIEEILTPTPTILEESQVAGFESSLSSVILEGIDPAIALEPDLAPAYFLRGWAAYISDPTSIQAVTDIRTAAQLAPDDTLYSSAAAYLAGSQ